MSQLKNKSIPQKFRLVCKSTTKDLCKVENLIRKISNKCKLDDGSTYRLLVASTEAVNNAITHGNKGDLKKEIIIDVVIYRRKVVLKVKDQGMGFDPAIIPDPRKEENLLKESGRGVFLIHSLMDDVKYLKTKTGMIVEMSMKCPK